MIAIKPENGFLNDQCEDFHEVSGPLTIRMCTLKNWNGSPKEIRVGKIVLMTSNVLIFECSDPETLWVIADENQITKETASHILNTDDFAFYYARGIQIV